MLLDLLSLLSLVLSELSQLLLQFRIILFTKDVVNALCTIFYLLQLLAKNADTIINHLHGLVIRLLVATTCSRWFAWLA